MLCFSPQKRPNLQYLTINSEGQDFCKDPMKIGKNDLTKGKPKFTFSGNPNNFLKIVVVGEGRVGKTCILRRYVNSLFDDGIND